MFLRGALGFLQYPHVNTDIGATSCAVETVEMEGKEAQQVLRPPCNTGWFQPHCVSSFCSAQAQKKPVTQEMGLAPSMAMGRPENWEPRIGSVNKNIPGLGLSEDSVGSYFEQGILPDVVRERQRLQMVPDFQGFTFRWEEQM